MPREAMVPAYKQRWRERVAKQERLRAQELRRRPILGAVHAVLVQQRAVDALKRQGLV